MAKRMLIDATQPEETRVAVIDGNRLDELDFEIDSRKQLKGNIYLAKVTRVEPSLQACFVDYGGNRHGFLAFAEIHPDYYRIPVADKEKLLELERELEREEAEREEAEEAAALARLARETQRAAQGEDGADLSHEGASIIPPILFKEDENQFALTSVSYNEGVIPTGVETSLTPPVLSETTHTPISSLEIQPEFFSAEEVTGLPPQRPALLEVNEESAFVEIPEPRLFEDEAEANAAFSEEHHHEQSSSAAKDENELEVVPVQTTTPEESEEDADRRRFARRRAALLRQYKIQEVIKRNQILLIQVVKEERGNKGAALTTYLSLAGRYCVLMPNTNRGGGVSRKINSVEERRRMKSLLSQLSLPEGMSVILRTAGLERSKNDIKRDLEYVMRLWDSIREKTLNSTAPSLIHEEANLIRRAVRDLYSRDVAEIQVEGDSGYQMAKEFMRMIMPSAARRVHHYRDPAVPLFVRYRIESQIEALYTTSVTLKSGGYIVINQTEALVAIDVNSGRSTRERNIEETALRTNLEAADEIARQLRLRDLAGLIVIDFIDMEDPRHNAQVERKMRDAMKNDRARIQIGRISMFGLLELSRQRLRPSLIETNFSPCKSCGGIGHTRSIESAALHVLRTIEEEGLQQKASEIAVNVADDVALYLLNHKREAISDIERRYGIKVYIHAESDLLSGELKIDRLKARQPGEFKFPEAPPPLIEEEDLADDELDADEDDLESETTESSDDLSESETEEATSAPQHRAPRRGRYDRRNRRGGEKTPYPDMSQPGAPQPEMPSTPVLIKNPETDSLIDEDIQPANLPLPDDGSGSYVPLTAHGIENTGEEENGDPRRRRRGRRGGRGRSRTNRSNNGGQENVNEGHDGNMPAYASSSPTTGESAANGNTIDRTIDRGPQENGNQDQQDRHARGRARWEEKKNARRAAAQLQNQQDSAPHHPAQTGSPQETSKFATSTGYSNAPALNSGSATSNGGIKILTEIKARSTTPPVSSSPSHHVTSAPHTHAAIEKPHPFSEGVNAPSAEGDKPKSGWWKRLIRSTT